MNRVAHFEIHATEPERAATFYRTLFGWEIKRWGEAEYWMVMTGKDEETGIKGKWGGIDGGMLVRKGPAPVEGAAVNAYVCTIEVANAQETFDKALSLGGTVALALAPMPHVGLLGYLKDTEGNIFGIIEPEATSSQA